MISPIQASSSPSLSLERIENPSPLWKQTILVSSIGLAAIAGLAQLFSGCLIGASIYGFLGIALYIGYIAQKNAGYSYKKEQYYNALQRNAENFRQECQSFRLENKTMQQNNQSLQQEVETLSAKLKTMQKLLESMDISASLTKDLLTSCVDVTHDQKKNEQKIYELLQRLEKATLVSTQKEVEQHVKNLASPILGIEKTVKQFFLHDTKASELLEVKKEFTETSRHLQSVKTELEKVQKELAETSAQLKKTSDEIESKITKLSKQESQLAYLKYLAPIILTWCKSPEIAAKFSWKEKSQVEELQKAWGSLHNLG